MINMKSMWHIQKWISQA